MTLAAVRGLGKSLFNPALSALVARVVPSEARGDANVLLGFSQSVAKAAGPALAGILIAVTNAGVVLAIDAGTYACSLVALSLLRPRNATGPRRPSMLRSLAKGWSEFTARPWLVASTVQFICLNFLVWGPFLILGPVLSHQHPSGARDWGLVMSGYGAGSILGALAALGRRPSRPLVVATIAAIGYAAPCALLAVGAPTSVIAAGVGLADIGSTVSAALSDTTTQQRTPVSVLARVRTFQTFGAFSLGPLALTLAGPAAAVIGPRPVLAFGAVAALASAAAVLLLPSVRAIRWLDDASETADT